MEKKTEAVAWYDFGKPSWVRDLLILLHIPYSIWFLSYIAMGAALAPVIDWPLLGWTILAFTLGMIISAHFLDELNGRPLKTTIPGLVLKVGAVISLLGALAIGITIGVRETLWLIPCIVFGGIIVPLYTLEWFGGKFHAGIWFAAAWGAFPVITAYVAQTGTLSLEAVLVAVFALLYSMAQRKLSLQARYFRRKVGTIEGGYYLPGEQPVTPGGPGSGDLHPITKDTIIGPVDLGLKYMNGAVVAAAIGLLLTHI